MPDQPLLSSQRAKPGCLGEPKRQHQADGHGLTVQQPVAKACRRFQRVAERMPQIEQRPFAGLVLISGDDASFHHNAGFDGVRPCVRVAAT